MKTYKIAAIPGDGIGTEVVSAGVEVLEALARRERSFAFHFDHFDWGGDYYLKHGRMMPEDGREQIRDHDAILFGSAGHPDISRSRDALGAAARHLSALRSIRQRPPDPRPEGALPRRCARSRTRKLDWVIVRENSEGEYAGVGGRVHQGLPIEAATDVSILTRAGVQRIMRFRLRARPAPARASS